MTEEERGELAKFMIRLLSEWGLGDEEKIAILALPESTKPRHLTQYRNGTPLPDSPEVNERVEHLLGIADALRTSNPCNASAGALWMRQPHHRFDNRTPNTTMIEDGLAGVVAVRMHVDCAYDWHIDAQKMAKLKANKS